MSEKKQAEKAPKFEQSLTHLEQVVESLESGELGLEDALGKYEQGVKLLQQCFRHLQQAQRRIEVLTGVDADGQPAVAPLDAEEGGEDLDEKAKRRSRRRSARPNSPAEQDGHSDVDESPRLF